MKILSEKTVKILQIEYEPSVQNRKKIENYLNEKYGKTNWSIKFVEPRMLKYRMTIEINLKD